MESLQAEKKYRDGDILGKIDSSTYWKWRFVLAQCQKAELNVKYHSVYHATLLKDQEIGRLKTSLYLANVEQAKDELRDLKAEYEMEVKGIEEKLGCSLKSCLIDDVTFEVKYLECEEEKKPPMVQ